MKYEKKFICSIEDDTKLLAQKFALLAQKGDIFALFGTLGAGKSTFSRYFIETLTEVLDIPSPTFTLVQAYEAKNFEIYHFDMYRLKNPEEAYELDIEDAFYNGVCLIEWPEKIGYLLPHDIWKIDIQTKGMERIFVVETNSAEKSARLMEAFGD
jgi:tRNA threonylcarbamoyladenosine biosynthesis protein TsaE